MKEYNETEAIELMCAAIPEEYRDNDSVCEVLDLIYDYYEDNGDLDIDAGDDDADVEEIVAYVVRYFKKNAPSIHFSAEQIEAMVRAEIAYEESLL